MRRRARSFVYLLAALAAPAPFAGCAGTRAIAAGETPLEEGRAYSFSATVNGQHRYRDRIVPFQQTVEGTLTVEPTQRLRVASVHESCLGSREPSELRISGDSYRVECGNLRFSLRATRGLLVGGTMSILITENHDVQGACISVPASNPRTGQRAAGCLEYSWSRVERQIWSRNAELVVRMEPAH